MPHFITNLKPFPAGSNRPPKLHTVYQFRYSLWSCFNPPLIAIAFRSGSIPWNCPVVVFARQLDGWVECPIRGYPAGKFALFIGDVSKARAIGAPSALPVTATGLTRTVRRQENAKAARTSKKDHPQISLCPGTVVHQRRDHRWFQLYGSH